MSTRSKNSSAGNRKRSFIFRQVNSVLKREQSENEVSSLLNRNDDINSSQTEAVPDKLKQWAIEFGITRRALSALLKILISAGLWYLPSDSRTLLKTPHTVSIYRYVWGKILAWWFA